MQEDMNMAETIKAAKKRNVAIEFWRAFVAIAIVGFHTGWIIARSCNGSLGYWMETSNWFLVQAKLY